MPDDKNQPKNQPMEFILGHTETRGPAGKIQRATKIQVDTEDWIAFAVLTLAIGAAFTGFIVAIFWGLGRIDGDHGSKVIIACVGSSGAAALATAFLKRKRKLSGDSRT